MNHREHSSGFLYLQRKTGSLIRSGNSRHSLAWFRFKQWAIQALQPVLLFLHSREADSYAQLLLSIVSRPNHLVNLTKKLGNCRMHPTASVGQGTKTAVLSNCSQSAAPTSPFLPLTSELRQWLLPKVNPNSKPHLPKNITSRHTQNTKLSSVMKNCL